MFQEEFSGPLVVQTGEDMNRDQLRGKLMELQNKKKKMDDMLQELHHLRSNGASLLNNGRSYLTAGRPFLKIYPEISGLFRFLKDSLNHCF